MKKHLKFNKKHNNIIKSKIFLKILPLLIAGSTLGSCEKPDDTVYTHDIFTYETEATPSGSSNGHRPTGDNTYGDFTLVKTQEDWRYHNRTDYETAVEYYKGLDKYKDGMEANIYPKLHTDGYMYKDEILLYVYKNAKSKQVTDTLKQNAR